MLIDTLLTSVWKAANPRVPFVFFLVLIGCAPRSRDKEVDVSFCNTAKTVVSKSALMHITVCATPIKIERVSCIS